MLICPATEPTPLIMPQLYPSIKAVVEFGTTVRVSYLSTFPQFTWINGDTPVVWEQVRNVTGLAIHLLLSHNHDIHIVLGGLFSLLHFFFSSLDVHLCFQRRHITCIARFALHTIYQVANVAQNYLQHEGGGTIIRIKPNITFLLYQYLLMSQSAYFKALLCFLWHEPTVLKNPEAEKITIWELILFLDHQKRYD